MSSAKDVSEEIRQELIRALDNGKWDFTQRALQEGLEAFRAHSENPYDLELIDYILDLLKSNFPLRCVDLRDPPTGEAYEMQNTDGQDLYIKLKFEAAHVLIMSFHY